MSASEQPGGIIKIASAAIFLAFEPSPAFVQRVIQWLTDFCHLVLEDIDVAFRLQLAVSELVENVVKYGLRPDVHVKVELIQRGSTTSLRLSTVNRASREQLDRAVELLTQLRDAEDPVAFYDELILKSAPLEGVSGLGLARIKAEGELDLDFQVEDDRLTIGVEAAVEAPPAAGVPTPC